MSQATDQRKEAAWPATAGLPSSTVFVHYNGASFEGVGHYCDIATRPAKHHEGEPEL